MATEIVDLPINSMVIFHSFVNIYQRVIGESGWRCLGKSQGENHQKMGTDFNHQKRSFVFFSSLNPRGMIHEIWDIKRCITFMGIVAEGWV